MCACTCAAHSTSQLLSCPFSRHCTLHPSHFTDTAGAYRYKIYKFGTDHTISANVVYNTTERVEIEPWINATTTFDTPDLSPGLYSVWVQAEHKDYSPSKSDTSTLFTTATSPVGTSYAIGAQGSSGLAGLQAGLCAWAAAGSGPACL